MAKTKTSKPAATTKPAAAKAPAAKPAAAAKKAAKPKAPAGPVAIPPPPPPAVAPATPKGSAAAYAKYLPIAQKQIPAAQVVPYRQDPALAAQNISTGLAALAPYKKQLAKLPAPFDLGAMNELPAIAIATMYAAAQVDLSSPGTVGQLRKTAGALRDVLLSNAVSLMKAGVLPAADVQRIMKGKGASDVAQDCVDLAQLFTVNAAAVKGKTPVTQAQIGEATQVGDQLLALIKPKGTPGQPLNKTNAAVAARDQVAALMVAQYAQLRRAGMWIWVDDVDANVPPLHSHAGHKKKAAAVTAPAGTAAAAPAAAATATAGG